MNANTAAPTTPVNQPIVNNVRVPLAPLRLNVPARPVVQQPQEDGVENGQAAFGDAPTRYFMRMVNGLRLLPDDE